jgi:hypothetical protein
MIEINVDLQGEAVYTVTPATEEPPVRKEDCPYCEDECNQQCEEE